MNKFIPFIMTLLAFSGMNISGISQPIREKTHEPNIRTVQIHKKGEPLSPPVLALNSRNKIILSYDDLEGGTKTFSYKLIHCNADWKPSELFESDYLSGQFTGEIHDYSSSFNTIPSYTHYRLKIPNDIMTPVKSGNYIIMVYKNYNPQDTVLTRRLRITETKLSIAGTIDQVNRLSRKKPNQELNLTLQTGGLQLNNPYNNLKIAIQKNYHGEQLFEYMNPSSMQGNKISYEMNKKLTFKGGNEYHHFNTKTTDYTGEHIRKIDFIRNNFHFRLDTDNDRSFEPYNLKKDLNGRFFIDKENTDNPQTEADYVYVYFTLKDQTPPTEGHFYVAGAFNNWECNPENRMQYDSENKLYQKRLYLKQGYYDFKYLFKSNHEIKPHYISGNHYQTENEYLVFVYYSDQSKGYDRLLSHTLINSLEREAY